MFESLEFVGTATVFLLFSLFWFWWSHVMINAMFPKVEENEQQEGEE